MEKLYPEFNTVEAELVASLSDRKIKDFTRTLRDLVNAIEGHDS
jgi:hypothetical protein